DRLSDPDPAAQTVWPFDIGIVGTGIVGTHQLTREAEEVIRRSKRTFVIDSGYGIPEYLETLCPEVTELAALYEPGRNRLHTDLLLRQRPIQNDVTCIVWQPTIFGDPTYPTEPYTAEQYKPLQDYLLRFYPADHEASLVMTKTFPLTRSVVQHLQLGDLAAEL